MRQFILYAFFCVAFCGCNSTTNQVSEVNTEFKPTKQVTSKKFFSYDAIDYYKLDETKNNKQNGGGNKSIPESFKREIVFGHIPKDIFDLAFIEVLEKIGYVKKNIDNSKFQSIDSIFVEKNENDSTALACKYVFRDILIFIKNNKVVGTAKVCFSCSANQINGTMVNTANFGQNGDYEKLRLVLESVK